MVMGLCERLIVLHHGELLAEGSPDEIRGNAEVRRVYLGQG
jgi:branched-chain amino acid transport system ATP-binding protein